MTYSGLYTALVTPFKDDALDEEGLKCLIERQNEAHVDGVLAFGATGESITLTIEEKMRVLKSLRKDLKSSLMVGVGSASTQMTIDLARIAEFEGADSLLVVTPYYNKPTQEGIYRHFEAIAKSTTLPIIVYNMLGRSGVGIEVETLKRLSLIPNIMGTKDCSKNLSEIEEILATIKKTRPEFTLFSGDDAFTFPIMTLGGDGVISTASNLVPREVKSLVNALKKQDITKAREMHFALTPLFNALFTETNPIPLKAALSHWNLPGGDPRLPLTPMSEGKKRALIAVLERYK